MKFLFTTLGWLESDFYGLVTDELRALGHDAVHATWSREAAQRYRERGYDVYLFPEEFASVPPFDARAEERRILEQYDTPTLRDIYKTDWACRGRSEQECVDRTIRHFRAIEQIVDATAPDIIVPEVGSESFRTVTHLVGLNRRIPVFFLFYTIFDDPLRLYADTMHAPIVPADEVRPLSPDEREDIESFIARFKDRDKPIRAHTKFQVDQSKLQELVRHLRVKRTLDRDNEYLRPWIHIRNRGREKLQSPGIRTLYKDVPDRPYVYFPLHVTDDYKIKRVIPHCVDQAMLIEQVADCLPHGMDLVLKEHPLSIGRNPYKMLRRLTRVPNVRLVNPYVSSHQLMQDAEAIVVISSTVGLEALMYDKPVLTMGEPFYAGYGVTLDLSNFKDIRARVPEVLDFEPDHERILEFLHAAKRACYPGRPMTVNQSPENARELASSLDRAAREGLVDRREAPVSV